MSLDRLQRRIAEVLKARRSSKVFVGGAVVLNENAARVSDDMDIYAEDRPIAEIAAEDLTVLAANGLPTIWRRDHYGFAIEAEISDGEAATMLEWSEADQERFFPAEPHPTFGWALNVADLAVLKLIASATRRKARDVCDLLSLEDRGFAFSALALAAPAKLPGASPIALLDRARLTAIGLPADDFDALRWDAEGQRRAAGLIKLEFVDRVQKGIDELMAAPPAAAPGVLYLDAMSGLPVTPTAETLSRLNKRVASRRGALPRMSSASTI